ncbi:hypothetical protein OA542_00395 [Opitutae bacterium]|nr:hypothetical protein [Opitutae bacterium]
MKKTEFNFSTLLSFVFGGLAILVFLLILMITYLPNKPEGVDEALKEQRVYEADTIRAEGVKKLNLLELNNTESAKIPIESAMELILNQYRKN